MHELTKENIERMNAKYKLVEDKGRKHVVFVLGFVVISKISYAHARSCDA